MTPRQRQIFENMVVQNSGPCLRAHCARKAMTPPPPGLRAYLMYAPLNSLFLSFSCSGIKYPEISGKHIYLEPQLFLYTWPHHVANIFGQRFFRVSVNVTVLSSLTRVALALPTFLGNTHACPLITALFRIQPLTLT